MWVSDITYIQTDEGWLYLAVIMDLYSRRIVGWAFAHHLGAELVAAALTMALVHRRPPEGLVNHSETKTSFLTDYQLIFQHSARTFIEHQRSEASVSRI